MPKDDLDIVLEYFSRTWMPYEVSQAYNRLKDQKRYSMQYTGLGFGMVQTPNGEYVWVARPE